MLRSLSTRAQRLVRTPRRRKLAALTVSLALIAAPLAFLPSPASAASPVGSPYYDVSDGAADAVSSGTDPTGGDDTSNYGQGAKEVDQCPAIKTGVAPNKDDLDKIWFGSTTTATAVFAYMAWHRIATNGTTTVGFELNQLAGPKANCNGVNPQRSEGDILFTYDFQGTGPFTLAIFAHIWNGSTWVSHVLPAGSWQASISSDGSFGELVVDLVAAGILKTGVCEDFADVFSTTRASNSTESEMKDFTTPMGVQVTNCGSLTVKKTVVAGAGESFEFTVDCGAFDLNGKDDGTDLVIPLGNGGEEKIDDIPLGTTCSVTETNPGSEHWTTSYTVTGVNGSQSGLTASNIGITLGNKTVTFTNTRRTADLTVTKTVAAGSGEFDFTVDCGEVDLNGNADGTDRSFSLGHNGQLVITGIPVGTVCTVRETGMNGSQWATSYVIGSGSSVNGVTASNVSIGTQGNRVAFTNTRQTAALTVTKSVLSGSGTFNFTVACPGVDLNGDTAGTSLSFSLSGGQQRVIGNIPVGVTCSVSETDVNTSHWSTSYTVDGGSSTAGLTASNVEIGTQGNTIAFTNTRRTAGLQVEKDVVGGAGESFQFTVECENVDLNGNNPGTAFSFSLSDNGTESIPGIPVGTLCSVSENGVDGTRWITAHVVDKGGSESGLIASGISIGTEGNVVVFTNTRRTAGLRVTKAVAGGAGESFSFTVACEGVDLDSQGPGTSAAFSLIGGAEWLVPGVPVGASCSVSEADPGAARWWTAYIIDGGNSTSGLTASNVTIGAQGNLVAFTNTRKTGKLVVTKSANAQGTFVFDVNCDDGTAHDRLGIEISTGGSSEVTGIPTETACTVTERAHAWFNQTSVSPANGQINIGTGNNTVAFVNAAKPNGISIDKKVNEVDTSSEEPLEVKVGSTLEYEVVITNSGQVPLAVSDLSDTLKADLAGTCVPSVVTQLDPGESITCSYTMTADDPGGAPIIHNTATVSGIDIFDRTTEPDSDDTYVRVLNPAIHLEKDGPAQAHVGDTITYTLTVTNAGNTPLRITGWDDPVCSADPVLKTKDGDDDWLDLDEEWVFECSHVVVAGDPDQLVNTATVAGMDQLETEVDDTDDAVTNILRPGIAITKTGPASAHVGDAVVYTLVVTNPGNTPLASVTMSDPKCDGPPVRATVDADGLLSPGESWTYHCTHVATAADGTSILNTARAEGTDPLGQTVNSTDDHTAVLLHPAISIVKTASPDSISVAGTVTYTYVVTNTGDTTLFNVLVTDDILGPIGSVGRLEPGEAVTMAKTVDVDALTPPRNIGTAVATDALGQPVSASDDAVITVVLGAVLAQPELPRTGAPLRAQTWAALAMIQVGLVLTLAGRRRRVIRRAD